MAESVGSRVSLVHRVRLDSAGRAALAAIRALVQIGPLGALMRRPVNRVRSERLDRVRTTALPERPVRAQVPKVRKDPSRLRKIHCLPSKEPLIKFRSTRHQNVR